MQFSFTIQTEADFHTLFPDDTACEEHLKATKWPYGFVCPRCGHKKAYELKSRHLFQCTNCRHQTSLIANTLMQDTKLPLLKWFTAIFYICISMESITAKALERQLEVRYKTAWHLLHRIREALKNPLKAVPLEGQVIASAVPFTDVVGTAAWRAANRVDEPVVAVLTEHIDPIRTRHEASDGPVLLTIIDPLKDNTLAEQISSHIDPDAELIVIDNATISSGAAADDALILTTLSRLTQRAKNWLVGVFRGSVGRHLQRYLNEFVFRLNRWKARARIFTMVLGRIVSAQPLTYRSLTDSRSWLAS